MAGKQSRFLLFRMLRITRDRSHVTLKKTQILKNYYLTMRGAYL